MTGATLPRAPSFGPFGPLHPLSAAVSFEIAKEKVRGKVTRNLELYRRRQEDIVSNGREAIAVIASRSREGGRIIVPA